MYWSYLSTCTSPMYYSYWSTYTSLHSIEDSWEHILYFTVLNHFQYMYWTTLYWSFLSTCISLHCIEAYLVYVLHFTVLKLLEYMFLTSLHWSILSTVPHLTVLKLSKKNYTSFLCVVVSWVHIHHFTLLKLYSLVNVLYFSVLIFWVHVIHFTLLKLLEYMLIISLYWIFLSTGSSLNWILLSTCTSVHWIKFLITYDILHCTEPAWYHVPHFAILTLIEDIYYTSLYQICLNTCISHHYNYIKDYWVNVHNFIELNPPEYMYNTSLNWCFSSTSNSLHFTDPWCLVMYMHSRNFNTLNWHKCAQ